MSREAVHTEELADGFFLEIHDRVKVRDKSAAVPNWQWGAIAGMEQEEGVGFVYVVKLDKAKEPRRMPSDRFDIEKVAPRRPKKPKVVGVNLRKF